MSIKLTGKKAVSRGTESSYRSAMLAFENYLKEAKVQADSPPERMYVMSYINYMAEMRLRPTTLNMFVCALRFECLQKQTPLSQDDYRAYLNAVSQYRRVLTERGENMSNQKGPPLRPEDMKKLLSAMDESRHPNRERDAAAFALMWGGALRPRECAYLCLRDLEFVGDDELRIHIRRSKTDQMGEGQVVNVMSYSKLWGTAGVVERMREWLEARQSHLAVRVRGRDPESPLLFGSSSRGWQHLACKHWREQSGVDFTLYSFRIGFITTMAESDVALPQLQKLARHKTPNTTAIYYGGMDMQSAAAGAQAAAEKKHNVV